MSPLLFVALLGLLSGLVLFVLVVGIGALFNATLNRIPTKGSKPRAEAFEIPSEEAPEPEAEPALVPAPEMQLAAAAPVVEQSLVLEEPVAASPRKRASRSFPKRPSEEPAAIEEPVAAEPVAVPEPVAAAPAVEEVEVERSRRKFPRLSAKQPEAVAEEEAADKHEEHADVAAQASIEPADEPVEADQQVQKPEPADPFAAIMAALSK